MDHSLEFLRMKDDIGQIRDDKHRKRQQHPHGPHPHGVYARSNMRNSRMKSAKTAANMMMEQTSPMSSPFRSSVWPPVSAGITAIVDSARIKKVLRVWPETLKMHKKICVRRRDRSGRQSTGAYRPERKPPCRSPGPRQNLSSSRHARRIRPVLASHLPRIVEAIADARLGDDQAGHGRIVLELLAQVGDVHAQVLTGVFVGLPAPHLVQ